MAGSTSDSRPVERSRRPDARMIPPALHGITRSG